MKPLAIISIVLLLTAPFTIKAGDEVRTAFLLNHLQESEAYLFATLTGIEGEHWERRTEEGRWSIAECAEHILDAERGILQKICQQLEDEVPVKKQPTLSNEQVLNFLYDRINKKAKTIAPLEPKGSWKSKSQFLAEYSSTREELYRFLKTNEKNLDHYFTGSPVGEISLYQNVLLLSGHTARHTNQIEEIKKVLGLKTAEIGFGGAVKVNVHYSKRTALNTLFGDVLLLEVEVHEKYDRVLFEGGGFVVFYYQQEEDQLLSKEEFAKSMQAGLRVPKAYFESVKRRIIASGADEFRPGYKVDQQKNFYFHAPGGQVFRLIKTS